MRLSTLLSCALGSLHGLTQPPSRSLARSVGSVLCPPSQPVPVASSFLAQIIVFEPQYPITAGYAVELFHHSRDIPATIVALEALLDKTTGQVTRSNPRCVSLLVLSSCALGALEKAKR